MPNRFRLNRDFEPVSYSIELEPDISRFTFTGSETVRVRAKKPFTEITLHAAELKITRAALKGSAHAKPVPAAGIRYDEKLETVRLRFPQRMPAGELSLELEFSGELNDKMHGFYRTSYEVAGRRRWGAATQFEATDARRAFPCWDEPDRKASFEVTLKVPENLTALSNMPVAREQKLPGALKRIRYEPTPKMPTYLVAFVIADLESVETRDKNGVPIRVWTTPGKSSQGRFALEVGKHALEYFARWFGIRYSLPKLDMVALPDFASGAMENWGLVTYRETALLIDPANSSAQARQRVAEVIDHELAHQWFGNLVTMEWWTDLWLNEGFASYMGPKAVADKFPEWDVWGQFVAVELLSALGDDSLKNSHPIEIPVQDPHEIREIFDQITYNKGASVNRMLEHYLTEPVFRKGLSVYLKKYAFGNAKTGDLWSVLQKVSGKPVTAIMASYTRQDGYPVLSARLEGRRLALEQSRFLFDGSRDPSRRKWSVPLVVAAEGRKEPYYGVLRSARCSLPVDGEHGWIKLNPGQSGFYRTAYSPELLRKLRSAIAGGRIPAIDCLGIVDDTFALARAGRMGTVDVLELLESCAHETDYNLWLTIAGILGAIENILEGSGAEVRFAAFGRKLFGPLARRLGWEPRDTDGHLDRLLRSLALGRLGHFKDEQVVEEASARFQEFVRTGKLAPDVRGPVYGTVAEHGAEFERLVAVYGRTDLQEEKSRVLRALTRLQRRELVEKALAFALSDRVRKQDAYVVLGGFGGNPAGRKPAWSFIKKNWKTLTSRYSNGGLGLMTHIVEGGSSGFTTAKELTDVRDFFRKHPVPGTERAMKQSVEVVQANIRWKRRDRDEIARWLQTRP